MNDTTITAFRKSAPNVAGLGVTMTALLLDVPRGLVFWDVQRRGPYVHDDLGVLNMGVHTGRSLLSRGLVTLARDEAGAIHVVLTDLGRRAVALAPQDVL